ncbi:MAG: ligase-associated DNA damage response endonuclease PdeM [Rhizomicrobium sp.]
MVCNSDLHISVNGETVLLDKSGALFCPAHATLVFADLHFEKGSSFARRGALLPPYDTRATIKRMEETIARHAPVRVIALGDSFHDGEAADRLDDDDRASLRRLTVRAEWIWIEGNHDPQPPSWLGGRVAAEIALGGLVFHHVPGARGQAGEVAGHLHPATTVSGRGMCVRRRCFVSDGARLLMPAFGAYTGGLDVREAAIASLFADGFAVYALGRERVYAVSGKSPARSGSRRPHASTSSA